MKAAALLLCGVLACAYGKPQDAAAQTKPKADTRPPIAERITDNLIRVGAILVDLRARTVTCPGVINMDDGPIEYLAVAEGGKTHESLLRLSVRPLHLQVALLLLGLEPKNVLTRQGERKTPQGDPLILHIQWHDTTGKERDVRAESLVARMPGGSRMPDHPWTFTGSRILKEGFEADLDRSLVAVWHDPAAIVDNPLPEGGDNAYVVNARQTPPRGTAVELVLQAAGPARAADAKSPSKAAP